MSNLPKFEDTIANLKKSVTKWDCIEKIALTQALDRVLATDIIAPDNHPKQPTAAMDGYALKFSDLKENAEIKILGKTPAGTQNSLQIHNGECIKTFTGSLMASGSDTLIPIENVEVMGEFIKVIKPVSQGFAVRKIGESYAKGEILIKKGTRINYAVIGLLAELGISYISVFVRPKVAVFSTGSEIKELGESLENGAQIYSSNHIMIANLVQKMGCESIILPVVKDEKELLEKSITSALKSADIVLSTGGVSVGDFDFVKEIVKENFEIIVDKSAIKPGRHIKIAKTGEKYIFALPGFPFSAVVTCVLYLREFLNSAFGVSEECEISAILAEDYAKKSPFLEFSAVSLINENGQIYATAKGKRQGSSAILNNLLQNANLLVCPAERTDGLKKGEIVKIIKMP